MDHIPLYYAIDKIDRSLNQSQSTRGVRVGNYLSFIQGHAPVARGIAEGARAEYQQAGHRKVSRWILHFALHSLSLDPLPPASVVADCLSIIAIDLDCEVTDTGFMTSDERCVWFLQTATTLTLNQCTSGAPFENYNSETQNND